MKVYDVILTWQVIYGLNTWSKLKIMGSQQMGEVKHGQVDKWGKS
jgi:hypothetical protein